MTDIWPRGAVAGEVVTRYGNVFPIEYQVQCQPFKIQNRSFACVTAEVQSGNVTIPTTPPKFKVCVDDNCITIPKNGGDLRVQPDPVDNTCKVIVNDEILDVTDHIEINNQRVQVNECNITIGAGTGGGGSGGGDNDNTGTNIIQTGVSATVGMGANAKLIKFDNKGETKTWDFFKRSTSHGSQNKINTYLLNVHYITHTTPEIEKVTTVIRDWNAKYSKIDMASKYINNPLVVNFYDRNVFDVTHRGWSHSWQLQYDNRLILIPKVDQFTQITELYGSTIFDIHTSQFSRSTLSENTIEGKQVHKIDERCTIYEDDCGFFSRVTLREDSKRYYLMKVDIKPVSLSGEFNLIIFGMCSGLGGSVYINSIPSSGLKLNEWQTYYIKAYCGANSYDGRQHGDLTMGFFTSGSGEGQIYVDNAIYRPYYGSDWPEMRHMTYSRNSTVFELESSKFIEKPYKITNTILGLYFEGFTNNHGGISANTGWTNAEDMSISKHIRDGNYYWIQSKGKSLFTSALTNDPTRNRYNNGELTITNSFVYKYTDTNGHSVLLDNYNDNTVILSESKDTIFVPQMYIRYTIPVQVSISNITVHNTNGYISLPYLDKDYSAGTKLYVPILSGYSEIQMNINGHNAKFFLQDILEGEVWSSSGISSPTGTGSNNAQTNVVNQVLATSKDPNIHVEFTVNANSDTKYKHNGKYKDCTPARNSYGNIQKADWIKYSNSKIIVKPALHKHIITYTINDGTSNIIKTATDTGDIGGDARWTMDGIITSYKFKSHSRYSVNEYNVNGFAKSSSDLIKTYTYTIPVKANISDTISINVQSTYEKNRDSFNWGAKICGGMKHVTRGSVIPTMTLSSEVYTTSIKINDLKLSTVPFSPHINGQPNTQPFDGTPSNPAREDYHNFLCGGTCTINMWNHMIGYPEKPDKFYMDYKQ